MNYFRNVFPTGEFVQNQGTTRSNFTIKPSMPSADQSLWTTVAVSGGISTPGCDPTYEDIGVDFFERTYSPKQRSFRGPSNHAGNTFNTNIPSTIHRRIHFSRCANGWRRRGSLVYEATVMRLGDWFVDGVKICRLKPRRLPRPRLTRVDSGYARHRGKPTELISASTQVRTMGITLLTGTQARSTPLFVNMVDSQQLLKANPHMRDDARFASEA